MFLLTTITITIDYVVITVNATKTMTETAAAMSQLRTVAGTAGSNAACRNVAHRRSGIIASLFVSFIRTIPIFDMFHCTDLLKLIFHRR